VPWRARAHAREETMRRCNDWIRLAEQSTLAHLPRTALLGRWARFTASRTPDAHTPRAHSQGHNAITSRPSARTIRCLATISSHHGLIALKLPIVWRPRAGNLLCPARAATTRNTMQVHSNAPCGLGGLLTCSGGVADCCLLRHLFSQPPARPQHIAPISLARCRARPRPPS